MNDDGDLIFMWWDVYTVHVWQIFWNNSCLSFYAEIWIYKFEKRFPFCTYYVHCL